MSRDQIILDQIFQPSSTQLPERNSGQRAGCSFFSSAGFTLIELLIVVAIVAIVAALAIPAYVTFLKNAQYSRAMQEIRLLEAEIYDYQILHGVLPPNLAAINRATLADPWGNPYEYSATPARRYAFDFLNDDFDLYSKGYDGLTADLVHVLGVGGPGSDDMLRGANGAFLGKGAGWVGDE